MNGAIQNKDAPFFFLRERFWHSKVVKNSGSSITLQFSNYKFEVSRSGKTHEFILNGTLEFKCYMYD